MAFIVIEKHGGWEYAAIVTNEDGKIKVFDTLKEAYEEVAQCQDGIVVGDEEISVDENEAAFIDVFSKNVDILESYLKDTVVPGEVRAALKTLSRIKHQIL